MGHYCPSGSGLPTPCPAGRYNSRTGRSSPGECDICSPGSYCAGLGNSKPTGPCEAGYFCPAGSTSSQEFESPPGKFSLAIASTTSECLPGFYNSMYGQKSCLSCPVGYYCPNSSMVTYEHTICPVGHFCPLQSQYPQRCPIGTYSNDIGLSLQSQCLPCTPGSFCSSSGLHEVTGPCAAGYYCTVGAQLSTHDTIPDLTGGQCPEGHYCPENTAYPIQCPAGTYMSSSANTGELYFNGTQIFCDLCSAGHACPIRGMSAVGNTLCSEGYFCRRGSPSTSPICTSKFCKDMYGICPVGHFCERGTVDPKNCADGTYMDEKGAASCKICPSGYYCASINRTDTYFNCPQVILVAFDYSRFS